MEPLQNGTILGWYLALRDAGLDEAWVDGVRTSPMMRFDSSTLRVGVILDILSPQRIQASINWLCNFHVSVWYPWGACEAAATTSVPNIARLAPHAYQLQNLSSKGAPAQESHTGTRFVSPALGYEKKKMDTSRTGVQNAELSTLEHIILSTDGTASSAATGEALNE